MNHNGSNPYSQDGCRLDLVVTSSPGFERAVEDGIRRGRARCDGTFRTSAQGRESSGVAKPDWRVCNRDPCVLNVFERRVPSYGCFKFDQQVV
jgi:hypothetical protein